MNIYYYSNNYPEKRCILNKVNDNNYINISSKNNRRLSDKIIQKIQFICAKLRHEKTLTHYYFTKRNGIIHSFNYCILSRTNWVCTFETLCPRTKYTHVPHISSQMDQRVKIDYSTRIGLKALASDSCIRLLALSDSSMRREQFLLNSLRPQIGNKTCDKILSKLSILHPAQESLTNPESIAEKYNNLSCINIIFIGHLFFRKGGVPTLNALSKLSKEYNIHLTLVSSIDYDDDATFTTEYDKAHYEEIIKSTSWITWHPCLDNEAVLELCKKAHIGLFPSLADTYGYSVLEMQAAGCPVISTDIRALSEINNEECGWIIHLPQDEFGEAYYDTPSQRQTNYDIIYKSLLSIMHNIMDNTDILYSKALKAYERINQHHSPVAYANSLDKIYQELI